MTAALAARTRRRQGAVRARPQHHRGGIPEHHFIRSAPIDALTLAACVGVTRVASGSQKAEVCRPMLLGSSVERDAELTGEPQHFRHLGVELRLQVSKHGIVLVESGPGTVVLTGDEQVG